MKRLVLVRWLPGWIVAFACLSAGVPGSFAQQPATAPIPSKTTSDAAPRTPPSPVASDAEAAIGSEREYLKLLQLFVDTLDQIDRNYVTEVDRRKLVEAAVRGMLSELDPYSSYVSPEQMERFRRGVESEFGGVGIQVRIEGENLEIVSPIYGTPAYAAGLMAGDVILEIGGQSARGISIDDAVKLMKGKIGSEVTVKIKSPAASEPREVVLRRETIRLRTVLGERRREDDRWDYMLDADQKIGLIRVTSFGRHTTEELREAIQQLRDQGMRGLILDLRSNPGGLLSTAVEVCDLFISSGRIVSTSGRSSPKRTWEAQPAGTLSGFPMAVLVNRFSASASEIVSACLQDHQRAVVIGERTWGKGSVQNIIELEEGASAIKLTTAGYLRPSGANIHRAEGLEEEDEWGVRPDPGFEVQLTLEESRQLETERQERDLIPRRSPPSTASETSAPASPGEPDEESEKAPEETAEEETNDESETEPKSEPETEPKTEPKTDAPADSSSDSAAGESPIRDRQLEKAVEYLRRQLEAK